MKLYPKVILFTALGLLLPTVTFALPPFVPDCAKGTDVPQLSCFLQLMGNVSRWILGVSGSLALLFFVYGGFMFLTSRGNEEQITKGKTILTQAVIGIIIIFGAYVAVDFLMKSIGFEESKFQIPKEPETSKPSGGPTLAGSCKCECANGDKTDTASEAQCKSYCNERSPLPLYQGMQVKKVEMKSCTANK